MSAGHLQLSIYKLMMECEKAGYSGVVYLHHHTTKHVIIQCTSNSAIQPSDVPVPGLPQAAAATVTAESVVADYSTASVQSSVEPVHSRDAKEGSSDAVKDMGGGSAGIKIDVEPEVFDMNAFLRYSELAEPQTAAAATAQTQDPGMNSLRSQVPPAFTSTQHSSSSEGETKLPSDSQLSTISNFSLNALSTPQKNHTDPHAVPGHSSDPMHTRPDVSSYHCEICNMHFQQAFYWEKHMKRHRGNKPYRCGQCNKCFFNKGDLNRHTRVHTGERPYRCKICSNSFSQSGSLKIHMLTHTRNREKRYQCNTCGLTFDRAITYQRHIKNHEESQSYNNMISRGQVPQTHPTGEALQKPFNCQFCVKSFATNGDLSRHTRIHTGDKPYSCELCSRSFTQLSTLKTHLRTHTGERPYQCTMCMARYTQARLLKNHIAREHPEAVDSVEHSTIDQAPSSSV